MTDTPALNILLGVVPNEAHYDCELLGRRVWGEDAPCTREDWQARARDELAALEDPDASREEARE